MTKGEYSLVQWDQAAALNSILNQCLPHTQLKQLPPGNDPVLALRKLSDCMRRFITRRNAFSLHNREKALRPSGAEMRHAATLPGGGACVAR
jgi:hypothetical protein